MRATREPRSLQAVYYAYVALSRVAQALPESLIYGLADVIGGAYARVSKKRGIVAQNLARVSGLAPGTPALDELVVEAFKSYAVYWVETFRLARAGRDFFLERFVCHGAENIDAVLRRGGGGVLVMPHLSNWDAAGAWLGASGRPVVTVAEVLNPQRLFDFFVAHRAALGMTVHAVKAGVTAKLLEALKEGGLVGMVGDRDISGRGPKISFFGEPASFPAGPATLAIRTGAPVMVAGVYSAVLPGGRRGWIAEISEPLEPPSSGPGAVEQLTAEIVARFESYIAKSPQEWHVFQPFWVADRRSRTPTKGSRDRAARRSRDRLVQ